MKLAEVKQILKARVIVGDDTMDLEVRAAAASDIISDLLRGQMTDTLLLTGLNNIQVIRTSAIAGISAVVLVRGKEPNDGVVSMAHNHQVPLFSTPFTMFSACGRLFAKGLRGVDRKNPATPDYTR